MLNLDVIYKLYMDKTMAIEKKVRDLVRLNDQYHLLMLRDTSVEAMLDEYGHGRERLDLHRESDTLILDGVRLNKSTDLKHRVAYKADDPARFVPYDLGYDGVSAKALNLILDNIGREQDLEVSGVLFFPGAGIDHRPFFFRVDEIRYQQDGKSEHLSLREDVKLYNPIELGSGKKLEDIERGPEPLELYIGRRIERIR